MAYVIISFIGDYPVEHQPYWDQEFKRMGEAVALAQSQHYTLTQRDGDEVYTIIINKDNEDVVLWIAYKGTEIRNRIEATKLADSLLTP